MFKPLRKALMKWMTAQTIAPNHNLECIFLPLVRQFLQQVLQWKPWGTKPALIDAHELCLVCPATTTAGAILSENLKSGFASLHRVRNNEICCLAQCHFLRLHLTFLNFDLTRNESQHLRVFELSHKKPWMLGSLGSFLGTTTGELKVSRIFCFRLTKPPHTFTRIIRLPRI